ncbi:hypothetical protein [Amycolatopsis magusensis]|uniref:Lipoprotein n=1 Tax=Amycolatopsis magusensis TaxID=882444 RepID=A0ABS4PUW7_9PSEU|nr:hypothetical protein [Amycolatopsis magusensis]MBP2182705.1 hypothetical protein [Amycolatopsis magusensis]MDI5976141.1 hypothetical protein [Amycolatopsis magusensis]
MKHLRSAAVASAFVFLVAGCAGPPPTECQGGLCTGPAYWPSTATQIENGFVAVFSAIGVVPIVPRSANGPARRTIRD